MSEQQTPRQAARVGLPLLTDEELLAELAARCGGMTPAVLRIAGIAGVAVNYQDREVVEMRLGVAFTAEEWEQVRRIIGGYDERVDQVWGVSDAVTDWMMELVGEAGLDLEALQARRAGEVAAPVRACRVCGCTDDQACVGSGRPCSWAGPDLCTQCVAVPT